ncbi:Uncharacterised protein [Actinobacillus pleuropneumoniae]|nr:Uncharacterised protein [Actinobacillus pleuropneumoniae]
MQRLVFILQVLFQHSLLNLLKLLIYFFYYFCLYFQR